MARKKKSIQIESFYPYPVETVWEAITNKEALSKWLMETDFEPQVGKQFQFRAKPMKGWRGYVDCEVLEVVPNERLVYSWQGMPEHNVTVVTYELQEKNGGTVLKGTHEGFDESHGWLSGLMLRAILKAGWKKMYAKLLPQTISNIAEGRAGAEIVNDVNCNK